MTNISKLVKNKRIIPTMAAVIVIAFAILVFVVAWMLINTGTEVLK
jgi:hypothetical protein